MKLTKLSLVAIIVAGISASSAGADTLAEALQNTEFNGVLRQVWREEQDTKNGKETEVEDGFSVGVRLEGSTGEFYGFSANFGFQTSYTPDFGSRYNNDTSFAVDNTNMHIANIAYSFKDTDVQVGRMYIKTPLVRNRSSRIMKDFFNAALVTNTSIPNTEIIAGAITEWTRIKTEDDGSAIQTFYDKPIYTVYANTLVGPLDIVAQVNFGGSVSKYENYNVPDGIDTGTMDYYLEAAYKIKGDFPITLGAQYIGFKADKDILEDGDMLDDPGIDSSMYGLMAKVKVGKGFGLGVHYTAVKDKDGYVRGGIGESSDPSWNSMNITDANEDGMEAIRGTVYYKGFGLETQVYYASFDSNRIKASKDYTKKEYGLEVEYKLNGAFKGLSFEAKLANVDQTDGKNDGRNTKQYRFYTQYKF